MTPEKFAHLRLPRAVMPVEAFIGGNGDLVLMQEHPEPAGGSYLRLIVHPADVETLINSIRSLQSQIRGAA
jgi:hypothetical protein